MTRGKIFDITFMNPYLQLFISSSGLFFKKKIWQMLALLVYSAYLSNNCEAYNSTVTKAMYVEAFDKHKNKIYTCKVSHKFNIFIFT